MRKPESNPTMLVPGFFGGNAFFIPFRDYLKSQDVAAESWKRSPTIYRRRIDWYGKRLAEDLLLTRESHDHPICCVGWSEGGLIAVSAMRYLSDEFRNPEDIVRSVITFGTPFDGTWAAKSGLVLDRILRLNIREMRPGSATLSDMVEFLFLPRRWKLSAINGNRDMLVRAPQKSLEQSWCQYGSWDHRSLLWDRTLFDLIHRLILLP